MGEEAEQAIELLSEKGIRAVVFRPRVFRPFPKKELISLIKRVPRILVIDRAVSFGTAGQLAIEIQAELYANKIEIQFHQIIKGLGGMDVTYADIAAEVEKILKRHPDIEDVAIKGILDEKWGETGHAFVIPSPGVSMAEEDVIAICHGRLAKYKWPKKVTFTSEFPRTSLGKVRKDFLS